MGRLLCLGLRLPPPQHPHALNKHRVRKNKIKRIWRFSTIPRNPKMDGGGTYDDSYYYRYWD